jgi:hypothetical protein
MSGTVARAKGIINRYSQRISMLKEYAITRGMNCERANAPITISRGTFKTTMCMAKMNRTPILPKSTDKRSAVITVGSIAASTANVCQPYLAFNRSYSHIATPPRNSV